MAKLTYGELLKSSDAIGTFTNGILWEFDFSLKLNENLKSAREHLETFREEWKKVILSKGGERINTGMGEQYAVKPPVPKSLDEKATPAEIQKADEEYEEEVKKYEAVEAELDVLYNELKDKTIDVKVNKIPVGEFKSNFTSYVSQQMRGQKFSLSPNHIENLGWLINFSKKKK